MTGDDTGHSPVTRVTVRALQKAVRRHGGFLDPSDLGFLDQRSVAYLLELYVLLHTNAELLEAARKALKMPLPDLQQLQREPVLLVKLRDYQEEYYGYWTGRSARGILEMATATGKTVIGLHAIQDVNDQLQDRARVLVAAPSHAILEQWRGEIRSKLGIEPSVVNPGSTASMVELWTVQTLRRQRPNRKYDLAIFDEVHHLASKEWRKALRVHADRVMGLSATVQRDVRLSVLEKELGPVVATLSVGDARDRGILPDFRWIVHPVELSPVETQEFNEVTERISNLFNIVRGHRETAATLRKLRARPGIGFQLTELSDLGDFIRAYNATVYGNVYRPDRWNTLFGLIQSRQWISHRSLPKMEEALKLIGEVVGHEKCMITTMDIATAERIARELPPDAAYLVHSRIGRDEVHRRIQAFKDADHGALIAPKLLDEGIDVPDASIGFNVASSKSRIQLIQRLGRILRPYPGKNPEFHHFVTLPPEAKYLEGIDDVGFAKDLVWIRELGNAIRVEPEIATPKMNAEFVQRARATGLQRYAERLAEDSSIEIELPEGSVKFQNLLDRIDADLAAALHACLKDVGDTLDESIWKEVLQEVRKDHEAPQGLWWIFVRYNQDPASLLATLEKKAAKRNPNVRLHGPQDARGDRGNDERESLDDGAPPLEKTAWWRRLFRR